jgi:cysteine desulfurase/selenocysteine lyase
VSQPATDHGPRFDVTAIRRDFPALHQTVHGKPLVYLDNAATTQKPNVVIEAIQEHYARDCANIHRGVHLLSQRATDQYENARATVARHLNASSSNEIVFVRSATEAINLVAHSFVRPRLQPGDEIILTELEHHANIVPWQLICEERGAAIKVVPMSGAGELDLDAYTSLLGPRTRFVAVGHVSNALGTINPVAEMVQVAHEHGVPVLVDGAQAVPHMAVDVAAVGADFYAFSGHKVFGPTGIGALWGRRALLEEMPPYQGGGDMILSVTFEHTEFSSVPFRFEAGTPHVAGAIGLAAALGYINDVGMDQIAEVEATLLARATAALEAIPGLRLIGTAEHKAAVLSFLIDGVHPHDAGTIFDQRGVAVRAGHHCAQPAMQHFGVPATVRASLAFYNTAEEIDALVESIRAAQEVFAR